MKRERKRQRRQEECAKEEEEEDEEFLSRDKNDIKRHAADLAGTQCTYTVGWTPQGEHRDRGRDSSTSKDPIALEVEVRGPAGDA